MGKYRDLLTRYWQHHKTFWIEEFDNRKLHSKLDVPTNRLYSKVHDQASPTFILSTGRSGTKLLSDILELSRKLRTYHKPHPELTYFANYAYASDADKLPVLSGIIDSCRYELIRDCFVLEKLYVETNNRVTFFAPHLANLYPKSKFVHLQRDVYKFVESGYSRNWYSDEKLFDEGRITPENSANVPWSKFSQVQKITWLWQSTNQFIRSMMVELSAERKFFIYSEELYQDVGKVMNLLDFIGVTDITQGQVERKIRRPVNVQPRSKRKKLTENDISEIDSILEAYHETE